MVGRRANRTVDMFTEVALQNRERLVDHRAELPLAPVHHQCQKLQTAEREHSERQAQVQGCDEPATPARPPRPVLRTELVLLPAPLRPRGAVGEPGQPPGREDRSQHIDGSGGCQRQEHDMKAEGLPLGCQPPQVTLQHEVFHDGSCGTPRIGKRGLQQLPATLQRHTQRGGLWQVVRREREFRQLAQLLDRRSLLGNQLRDCLVQLLQGTHHVRACLLHQRLCACPHLREDGGQHAEDGAGTGRPGADQAGCAREGSAHRRGHQAVVRPQVLLLQGRRDAQRGGRRRGADGGEP
mmetsp:Transcript_127698/g.408840  ORF Transcript_127698/g.408840 Transcript_127698/m.408840 type:complete len:295 (+) Transcript_127698:372-1256(+)